MSSEIVFRTQLASIMEVLANAAVEEISKLVDDGYAILHLEMTEYQKENESLKMRLHVMELEAARGRAERTSARGDPLDACFEGVARETATQCSLQLFGEESPSVVSNAVFGLTGGGGVQSVGPGVEVDNPAQASGVKQPADAEPDGTKSRFIKEENPEEGSDPQRELKTRGQGGAESCVRGEEVAPPASPERAEELAERPGTRRHLWECAGVEEGRTESLLIKDERLEEDSDPQGEMNVREERAARFHTSDAAPEKTLFHSQLQAVSPTEEGAGNGLSSFQSLGVRPEAMTVDSTPVKVEALTPSAWEKDPVLRTFSTRNRRYREDRERVEMLPGNANSALLPQTRTGVREKTAAPDTNRFPPSDKIFTAPQSGAVTHQRTGAEKRRFICKYCGKGFNGSNELKVHHRVHTGEKPYHCTHCGRGFSQSCSLKKHQTVHTGEKPYHCTHCGRGFSQSCSLKKHQTVHTGEKPFSCPQCGKRFSDAGNLRRHLNVHTGYKPFSCAYCGKEYSDSNCLKKHQAVHEVERELSSRYTHPAN